MRLIDADWVLNALTVYGQSYDYVSVGRVTQVIEDAPTIGAELVRRGRWGEKEHFTNDECPIDEWQSARCSVCGKYHTTPYMYYFDVYNYCPNCGAKMEG